MSELRFAAALRAALLACDPADKCAQVAALPPPTPGMVLGASVIGDLSGVPGRPQRPPLVRPRDVPTRGLGSAAGRAALAHAVAHIEFNAINLALDACLRFSAMPAQYYCDWLRVAQDEARHFSMMRARLRDMGYDYGDFPAHNGLWEAAEKTADDVLARMALVPRVLEARGLDVTPHMIHRLEEVGDQATADILQVILAEEVPHVAIGTRWFRHVCAQRQLEPAKTFRELLQQHGVHIRAPLNWPARMEAGFEAAEVPAELLAQV